MTTFTTEDRLNASPPHIVDSGASVMIKELTDDEILALWKPRPETRVNACDLYAFARAILRKAQEK
jgi:hypothetical protein